MKQFEDLEFNPHPIGNGVQSVMTFENKRGVSVVKFQGSYGYPDLWELAVLNKNGQLDYSTEVTDDVLGHLTDQEVTEAMQQVESLTEEV